MQNGDGACSPPGFRRYTRSAHPRRDDQFLDIQIITIRNTSISLTLSLRCWTELKTTAWRVDTMPNAVITIAIRLRYDYDLTTTYRARLLPFDAIRREQK